MMRMPILRRTLTSTLVVIIGVTGTLARPQNQEEKRKEFTFPGLPWTLTIPAGNFKIAQKQVRDDGTGVYFHLVDEKRKIDLSMFIEPAAACKDSKSCRDLVWKSGNPTWINIKNVVQSEIGEISTLEFLLPSFQGMDIQQQNLYAEFVVDGYWVDMHISKVLYQPEDHKLFEQLVQSVRFEPKKNNKT